MKLIELMRLIQDACLNDGNLEKEVIVVLNNHIISIEEYNIIDVKGQLNQLQIHIEEWPNFTSS